MHGSAPEPLLLAVLVPPIPVLALLVPPAPPVAVPPVPVLALLVPPVPPMPLLLVPPVPPEPVLALLLPVLLVPVLALLLPPVPLVPLPVALLVGKIPVSSPPQPDTTASAMPSEPIDLRQAVFFMFASRSRTGVRLPVNKTFDAMHPTMPRERPAMARDHPTMASEHPTTDKTFLPPDRGNVLGLLRLPVVISAIAVDPKGEHLAVAGEEGTVILIDLLALTESKEDLKRRVQCATGAEVVEGRLRDIVGLPLDPAVKSTCGAYVDTSL